MFISDKLDQFNGYVMFTLDALKFSIVVTFGHCTFAPELNVIPDNKTPNLTNRSI